MGKAIVPAVIAISTSLSPSVYLDKGILVAIHMPSAWDTGNLTFQGSNDNVTFDNVYTDAGTEFAITAAASRYIIITSTAANNLSGLMYIKVRSGTSGTPVTQTAARTIYLIVEDV